MIQVQTCMVHKHVYTISPWEVPYWTYYVALREIAAIWPQANLKRTSHPVYIDALGLGNSLKTLISEIL